MQFYSINVLMVLEDEEEVTTRRGASRGFGRDVAKKIERYTEKIADKGYFFLSYASKSEYDMGMVTTEAFDVKKYVTSFVNKELKNIESIEIRETTLNEFERLLNDADRNGHISDAYEVLKEYNLDSLTGHRKISISFEEDLIKEREKDIIYNMAKGYFTRETFFPELDRIFTPVKGKQVAGHPVNYIIESDDERTAGGTTKLLLQALYNVGRVNNCRYCKVEYDSDSGFSKRCLDDLYKSCEGGAVIIELDMRDTEDSDLSYEDFEYSKELCEVIMSNSRQVLTILCLPRQCKSLKIKLFEDLGNLTFVEIKEEVVFDDKAKDYLKRRAKEFKIRADKRLYDNVESGTGYNTSDLNGIFDEWYNHKLKTSIYKQYKDIDAVKKEVRDQKPKGSAYDELESMIGLSSAKKVIHQALDSYKASKLFKDKGIVEDECSYHMIFTGNPGTAKTTVARLFARILKDNEILESGHIVEVGRGDLVGKYVGWTAPTIQRKFKQASGGILFIDEAYSLVDDRDGSYGDEAINTIVQEMENHRGDVIVIFAGYPDKMEKFIDKNPGLRSRIAHYVNFEDYNAEELCQIAEHIAKGKGLVIDDKAMDKLHDIMAQVVGQEDFGNGRFARNVIEKAKMAQNSRLVKMDYDKVTADDVKRICAEDIEAPVYSFKKQAQAIGFAAS